MIWWYSRSNTVIKLGNKGVLFSCDAQPQPVERQIDDRRGIKREQLTQEESAHNRNAQGPAKFIASACAEGHRVLSMVAGAMPNREAVTRSITRVTASPPHC